MTNEGFVNPQELVSRIGIQEGMHVADFGSGSGDLAIIMARRVGDAGRISALDVLPSAIESVQAKAKLADLKNITAARANLEILGSSGLEAGSQDVVFLANILWQSEKKKEILDEAARILKSGGIVAAVEWSPGESKAGPPSDMRIGAEQLRQFVESVNLQFVESFPAGALHYGLCAKKP